MTAEERLKDRYWLLKQHGGYNTIASIPMLDGSGNVCLSPYDIDLIANLVVERLKKSQT